MISPQRQQFCEFVVPLINWSGLGFLADQADTVALHYHGMVFGYLSIGGHLSLMVTPKIALELTEDLLADRHPLLPNSRWISYAIQTSAHVRHALWLTRIAYVWHHVRTNGYSWGSAALRDELATLNLSPGLHHALTNTKDQWFNTKPPTRDDAADPNLAASASL